MARLARVVVPGLPHHITQRGNGGARRKRTGHFWQGRFGCVIMDEEHLGAALRYVSLNPVRARLVARAQDWRWSSTRAHIGQRDDGLTAQAPVRERVPRFADFLGEEPDTDERLRRAESIGRPLGGARFLARLERVTRRRLKPGKRGPKPRRDDQSSALSP